MTETDAKAALQCIREMFPMSKMLTPEIQTEIIRQLRRVDITAEQATACIRAYSFDPKTKGLRHNELLERLTALGRKAKAVSTGNGDPNTWPLWKRYQTWLGLNGGTPVEIIGFWHTRLAEGAAKAYGQQDGIDRACCGFVADVLREGHCNEVLEAAALAERYIGKPSESAGSWLLDRYSSDPARISAALGGGYSDRAFIVEQAPAEWTNVQTFIAALVVKRPTLKPPSARAQISAIVRDGRIEQRWSDPSKPNQCPAEIRRNPKTTTQRSVAPGPNGGGGLRTPPEGPVAAVAEGAGSNRRVG